MRRICGLQIKGKESENSYQELKRSQKGQAHTNTRSGLNMWIRFTTLLEVF